MKIAAYGYTNPNTGFGVAFCNNVEALSVFGKVDVYDQQSVQLSSPADIFFFQDFPHNTKLVLNSPLYRANRKIAYWVWESSELTDSFLDNAVYFDEIWTASSYCADILQTLNKPVKIVPHFVTHFAAPKPVLNVFNFLFTLDGGSRTIRKNPYELVECFKKAFGENNNGVKLTIKCKNIGKSFLGYLQKISYNYNIEFIVADISYNAYMELLEACDCYISLHRSEGFGLTLLEAMAMGKSIIASNHGGNSEFCKSFNSWVVPTKIAPVDDTFYKGSWGYINEQQAILAMIEAVEDSKLNAQIASLGFLTALDFSFANTIKKMEKII